MAGAEAAEDITFPQKSLEENSTTPKEAATQIADVLCFFNAPSLLYGQVNQTPQPQPVSG